MAELYDRLARSMTNHTPTGEQIERIMEVRTAAKKLAAVLDAVTPAGRERSLAATHLEETVMWAVKSIVLEGASE